MGNAPRLTGWLVYLCLVMPAGAAPTADEMEQWLLSDELSPPSQSGDSQLRFIDAPRDKPALHSINRINITPASLRDGWVSLQQCYEHLDPVPDMDVVYQYKAMRNLRISHYTHIESASIHGQSVQLHNLARGAKLCIEAEVKILYPQAGQYYQLVNGPFHRQFLDSFFPYHLTLQVSYPAEQLAFIDSEPARQPGFQLTHDGNMIQIETHFTGKLFTRLRFRARQ